MFDLANDRLSYSSLLRPEPGYTLDFALGMTYSLDLEALLGVPISLGLMDEMDEKHLQSPLYVLEAIRRSTDRIALLCNADGIHLPSKIQSVYSLLEHSVFPVDLVKSGQGGSFHPKLWVLKYTQEGCPSWIRLLVMSRNLTFDNSIDISASLQGKIGDAMIEKNRPLSDFLRFAADFTGQKRKKVLSLADDVMQTAFEVSHPFEDYTFYPIGIPGYPGTENPLLGEKTDLFAVSPFLSEDVINKIGDFNGSGTLITRKSSVTPAILAAFDQVYMVKDQLCDNESHVNQDIHAKIYYATTKTGNDLYLGSANASHNAFHRNIEFLIRFRYKLWQMGYKKFCKDFIPDQFCPYEKITHAPESQPEDPRKKAIEQALRAAVSALTEAKVSHSSGRYRITLTAHSLNTTERIIVYPLQCRSAKQPLKEQTVFEALLLKELSEFYVLGVPEQPVREVIVKVPTKGIPAGRDQEIYRSIINSREKFLRYLSFVLSGELAEGSVGEAEYLSVLPSSDGLYTGAHATSAIYEQLLQVFHQHPEKIREISDIAKRLDRSVVGEEFHQMLRCFLDAAKKVRK